MKKKNFLLLIVISLLLLPQLVLAKTKTVYLNEFDSNKTEELNQQLLMQISIHDYYLLELYGNREDIDNLSNVIKSNNYSVGDRFTIRLEDITCDEDTPLGYRIEDSDLDIIDSSPNDNLFNKLVGDSENNIEMCNIFREKILQDYDEIVIVIKEGIYSDSLILNMTSMDNFLKSSVYSYVLLSVLQEFRYLDSINEFSSIIKKDGKMLAYIDPINLIITIPEDVTLKDNIVLSQEELIDIAREYYRNCELNEEDTEREIQFLYNFNGIKVVFREEPTPDPTPSPTPKPTPIINPKTLTNVIAIVILCTIIAASFIIPMKKHKKTD